ncbi:MAG: ABC transporter ATP-binding protein [Planctomycetota bacterium]|nr:ABC transporter ATP-binding protein [Planctomycetota bacterium]
MPGTGEGGRNQGGGAAGSSEGGEKKKASFESAWREARDLISQNRGRLGAGLFILAINRTVALSIPYSSKVFVDDVLANHQYDVLNFLIPLVAAASIVQAATSFALSQLLGVAAQRAITEMRRSVQEHISRLPVNYFDSTQTGVLISRIMSDSDGIRNLVGTGLVQLTGGVVTATVSLCILFYLNWQMTLANVLVLATFGAGMAVAFKRLRPRFRERNKIQGEVTGRLGESLGGIRVVKSYTAEKREALVFARGAHKLLRNVTGTMTGVSAVTAFTTVIIGSTSIVIMIFSAHSDMTPGEFLWYIMLTGLMAAPVIELASIGTQISEAFAGLDRIREIKRMATEDAEDNERAPLKEMRGELEFRGVCFEYVPGIPVLREVSFTAPAGSTTALVGSSGSGKSTLISIAMTFNQPGQGQVLLDGRDLNTVRLKDYRAHLGVVLQENFLFDGTIGENIAFARPHATREEIQAAAKIAHADEFIERFPESYDSYVGERGVKLSGGQRQRIAIARAVLANPRILILDEATSSLDSESEEMIQDGLNSLRKGRTTFVIAHRLSTIRSADQILVLEEGRIVERGTHGELIALNGRYRQLHDKQFKLEANRYINPGEDFTPDPPKPAASTSSSGRGQF